MARTAPKHRSLGPKLFGKSTVIKWHDPQDPATHAAILQHAYAMAIREAAILNAGSVRQYAAQHDLPYAYLLDALRGDVTMRLETIAHAEMTLGGVHLRAMQLLGVGRRA